MSNSADPDQFAFSEANWSGSTLFAKAGYIRTGRTRVKAPIATAADNIFFSEKTSLDISCESSVWQIIHTQHQDLFSPKIKK